jgi:CheY-like chemotaxis protein
MTKSVLIVEDDADVRDSLKDALEDRGYEVRLASDGQQGLLALHEARPSVVVLDLIMPVMTGNELYAEMQKDPALKDVPVIVSTSNPAAAPAGVLTLRKPIDVDRLVDAIARQC